MQCAYLSADSIIDGSTTPSVLPPLCMAFVHGCPVRLKTWHICLPFCQCLRHSFSNWAAYLSIIEPLPCITRTDIAWANLKARKKFFKSVSRTKKGLKSNGVSPLTRDILEYNEKENSADKWPQPGVKL